jgi:transcriptional regulator with PAS, ATPase and Fis domain
VIADEEMRRIYGLAALVARSPINVLLLGDTGVGKELLAQTVHACSERAAGPFLALNCATFSETLLESELFGYEKGAFTGATQAKPGLLEAAAGGTVFLDEVGEMPHSIQGRLLRVLGAEESRRIGALKAKPIDVRFVSATNRDLAAAVERGDFRSDLYYRLNGMTLHVPPLRARPGEIGRLAERFIAMATQAMDRPRRPALTDGALARLKSHDWPGNVRELKNVIDRAVLMCRVRDIEPQDIVFDGDGLPPRPTPGAAPSTARPVREEIADLERERIVEALEAHGWNQTRAARALGMARGTLIKRMEGYGLSRPRKSS